MLLTRKSGPFKEPNYQPGQLGYTLDPLRNLGPDALDPGGIPRLRKITFCQFEIASEDTHHQIHLIKSDDLFAPTGSDPKPNPVPQHGKLASALFLVELDGSPMPLWVRVRPPFTLEFESPCLAQPVGQWLQLRGFIRPLTLLLQPPIILTPWQTLEAIPNQSAVGVVWQRCLGDNYQPFHSAFLQRHPRPAQSFPCPHECGCAHRVLRLDDGSLMGVCRCHPPACESFPLTEADITAWDLSWPKLSRALRQAFCLDPKPDTLNLNNTVQIGSWSANTVPAILTIQSEPREFLLAVTQLVAALRQPFILFGPTADNLTAKCQQYLHNVGAAFFALETHVRLTENGILLPTKTPGEIFAQFTPQLRDATDETIFQKAYAIIRALSSLEFRKAPSLLTVFELYCMQGLTATQIARQFHCAKATITNRLHTIRDRTGVHPDRLRTISSHLSNLQDQTSDSRAKHIHPRRLIDDQSLPE